ncbi:MAG: ATP-dependent endonuclease [Crocosphaera sp.]
MDIKFTGKYKSITAFEWSDIPKFAVITGPNGTGKSQLLQLIYNTIINDREEQERVSIENEMIQGHEITFIQGEWKFINTQGTNLAKIMNSQQNYFNRLKGANNIRGNNLQEIRLKQMLLDTARQIGKPLANISHEEFIREIPEIFLENEQQLSQKIEEVFYNYRLSEIEFQADGKTDQEIINEIGEKPWVVLKDILKESKLPFSFNDPSQNGIRDIFYLKIKHEMTGDVINFNDLSSGEKVLISLVFYLYSTQEKNVFPKLLLLDEPDAHLHPTMSQQFLNVIKNVLVDQYNVRVIMTTHSPSTVALTDKESVFEMSKNPTIIQKSPSKNYTISLLTSGLVYVGQGTRYFLVEDEADVNFYSYLYEYLSTENIINGDILFVFIPASTKNTTGGKSVVKGWVEKLQNSGLQQIIQGIIDNDKGKEMKFQKEFIR